MRDETFKDKVIVITGAARGIGLGIARRFGQAGAYVVVTDVDGEASTKAANMLRAEGVYATPVSLDVRDPVQSAELVEKLVEEYSRLDVWVNNAGVVYKNPAETLLINEWDESIAVMLSGAFYCSQASGRFMLKQGRGVIINIASISGYQHLEGCVAYGIPKAGLISLTEALGIEWASRGVRVVGVAPGVVMTDLVRKSMNEDAINMDAYERRIPMHRLATIEEIAEVVLFLASDEASYIVGETVRVDGGWVAYNLF